MKPLPLILTSAGLAVAIAAAIVYLNDSSAPPAVDSGASAALSISGRTQAGDGKLQRATADDQKIATGVSSGNEHPSQTEQVSPENYASNDPHQPWEKNIIALADRLDMSDTAKAEQLLSRIHNLPPDGKVLAMEYATKLIPDADYLRLRPLILSLISSEDLRQTVLLDALTRGETLRMPTLVEMLRQPANPAQEEVREILVAYLDTDYGTDTKKWDAAVRKFLSEHPDL